MADGWTPTKAAELIDLRNWIADQFIKGGGSVPHRGYDTGSREADLQIIAPDGTELELTVRVVGKDRHG